jgi:hypothetical protein
MVSKHISILMEAKLAYSQLLGIFYKIKTIADNVVIPHDFTA